MQLKIAVLGGDGIGPEVIAQAVKCLKAVEENFNHKFTFTNAPVGAIAMTKEGEPLPDATIKLCKTSDAILFGAIGTLKYDNNPEATVRPEQALFQLRKELGLFANIRPVKVFPDLANNSLLPKKVISGTDLVIYRELTGGIYFGKKSLNTDGSVATDECKYADDQIARIAHMAFKAAKKRKKKITLIDKANVLETSRLWRKVVTEISKSYPDVDLECLFVENAVVQLTMNPAKFDVILTDNMFGDILAGLGSVIIGSIGLLPSASVGSENAMFSPFHGSYPSAKGKNKANPIASIFSAVQLLQHFGLHAEARAVSSAVQMSFRKGVTTTDILEGSKYGTDYVGDFIANNIVDTDEPLNINDENIDLGRSTII